MQPIKMPQKLAIYKQKLTKICILIYGMNMCEYAYTCTQLKFIKKKQRMEKVKALNHATG